MPVEALASATGTATMEITVSKSELLKELTATQGVVERKTTIPILSNYLFEASSDKLSLTATDLDLSLRTVVQRQGQKGRLLHHPRPQTARLRKAAAGRRYHDQAAGQSLGQHPLRPVEHKDGWNGAVEFPHAAGIPHRRRGEDSRPGIARHDCQDRFRHCQRGIALHTERRADGAEA